MEGSVVKDDITENRNSIRHHYLQYSSSWKRKGKSNFQYRPQEFLKVWFHFRRANIILNHIFYSYVSNQRATSWEGIQVIRSIKKQALHLGRYGNLFFFTEEIEIRRQFQFVLLIFCRVLIGKRPAELHDQGVLESGEKSFFLIQLLIA